MTALRQSFALGIPRREKVSVLLSIKQQKHLTIILSIFYNLVKPLLTAF